MTASYVIQPAADQDLGEIADFYDENGGEELVIGFLLALEERAGNRSQQPRDRFAANLKKSAACGSAFLADSGL